MKCGDIWVGGFREQQGCAGQAAAVCAREQLALLCSLPPPRTQEREGYHVFTAGVYGGGAWSGSIDHPMMMRAGRAALSAFRPAWVVEAL